MSPRRRRSARAERAPTAEAAPAETTGTGRARWLLLGVVLLLSAVAVAGAFVPAPHSGGDNAGYVALAYSLLERGSYTELFDPAAPPHTKYPPVFPALLALLVLAGVRSWAGLKLVAAASTVAAAGLTFLWAERRLGSLGGAAAAVALALSSAVVYYSHWVLSDPTFLAFTVGALWALDRAETGDGALRPRWLAAGVALALLAYFTRSAGLPLLVAVAGWLALGRRWRALGAAAAAMAVPALLWWLRARAVGDVQYVSEFWMVDPYQPALGAVGPAGLLRRLGVNAVGYVTGHLPGGIVGTRGAPVVALGFALSAAGLAGWVLALRRRVGPVELFLPLYAGLILLWPEVWSGDRFALPLFPVLFVYAGSALWVGAGRLGPWAPRPVVAAAFLAVALPALPAWVGAVRDASRCAEAARAGGAFACYGPRYTRFAEAAAWAGTHLPDGASVLTRKPRIFYVLSGVPSRTFPFEPDAAPHLALADALGTRYALLDQIDDLAAYYVGGAVRSAPGAWCAIRGFGDGEGVGTQLLGVLPPEERTEGRAEERAVAIAGCPESYVGNRDAPDPAPPAGTIPLLEGLRAR